jgi:hypothetical protein
MSIQQTPSGATVFTGSGVTVYQALVVKQGLKACKLGLRLNRAYTPKRLMDMAAKITGAKLKPRDYDGAVAALESWVDQQRAAEGQGDA